MSVETQTKDVLTAEQRERRMREVEAEVTQLVGWGSEEACGIYLEKSYVLRSITTFIVFVSVSVFGIRIGMNFCAGPY